MLGMPTYGRISDVVSQKFLKMKVDKNLKEGKIGEDCLVKKMLGNEDDDGKKMQSIYQKLDCGKKLSHKEMEYLKEKNPELYEKIKRIQEEREEFEKKLSQCKTKEDVAMLQTQKSHEIALRAKSGENPKLIEWASKAMNDAATAFMNSDEYKHLPTQTDKVREENKEEKKIREMLEKQKETEEMMKVLQKDTEIEQTPTTAAMPDMQAKYDEYLQKKQNAAAEKAQQKMEKKAWLDSINFDIDNLPNSSASKANQMKNMENSQVQPTTSNVTDAAVKAYVSVLQTTGGGQGTGFDSKIAQTGNFTPQFTNDTGDKKTVNKNA